MIEKLPIAELSYEQAYQELEMVINLLEGESPSLDESMALFERGQALAQRCASLLDEAELKVRQLTNTEITSTIMGEDEDLESVDQS